MLCACSLLMCGSFASAQEAKHIIFMIADGWGFNDILATNYWHGDTAQIYETFPVALAMSTYSQSTLDDDPAGYDAAQAWNNWLYMLLRPTDSASAATAMSTGYKCYDGQINIDPENGQPLYRFQELLESQGKSTGVVTSVPWSHATPACFGSHNVSRDNYAQIARQMLNSSGLDVIMGAGHPFYNDNGNYSPPSGENSYRYVGGSAKWDSLVNGLTPYSLIQTRAEFQSLMSGATPDRVCGVARVRNTLQQARTPSEAGNSMTPPYTVAQLTTVPTLAEMTNGALNVLDNNPSGFFLMIEGGAVDWASHANQGGRMIEEMTSFADAVQAVVDWVETNSNWDETILVVTGDHETGYLWGQGSGSPANFNPIVNNGAGQMPGMRYYTGGHSNSLIPLFAKGVGSEWFHVFADQLDSVRGPYLDNTEIPRVLFAEPRVPLDLTILAQDSGLLTLTWRAVEESIFGLALPYAPYYHIFQRPLSSDTEDTLVATVSDTSFVGLQDTSTGLLYTVTAQIEP